MCENSPGWRKESVLSQLRLTLMMGSCPSPPRRLWGASQSWANMPSLLRFPKPRRLSAGREEQTFQGLSTQTWGHSSTCPVQRVPRQQRAGAQDDVQGRGQGLRFLRASQPQRELRRAELRARGPALRTRLCLPLSSPPQTPASGSFLDSHTPVSPGEHAFFGILCSCSEAHSPPLPFAIHSDLGVSANTQHREGL